MKFEFTAWKHEVVAVAEKRQTLRFVYKSSAVTVMPAQCCSQSCYQGLSLRRQGQGQDFFLKTKAKDIKNFQGQLRQLPLRGKIRIAVRAVTDTDYAYTRCSAIAERPRCRVRYSFRQK